MGKQRQDIELILLEALAKKSAEERAVYLDQACGDDVEARAELDSLLEFREKAGGFLEAPVIGSDAILDEPEVVEGVGTLIGQYKLLERIGEGGMAVVYMAEQEQPIRRKVALKIIKLGMDTKQVIARFEAERQALAMMDHPHIAKVFDTGATETGRPYFVMELVNGVSITEYCDAHHLTTKERLKLFVQVCGAVQHAHQKGIIHRDLKPSNVLVTRHDGQAIPKVIDFGIAKATNQRLTEKTLFTRYAQIIGTPAYMSPEQAELSDLDIDTRSDIYSLGVLLYELLIGTTPFSEEQLRQAGYLEMQRVIRDEEPTKPSTKLSMRGDTLDAVAKQRSSTPDQLRKTIRGDLDWIVMKAIEKDRVRRYDTVGTLQGDIQRHLKHEPVLAGPPSIRYRGKKFLRRHCRSAVVLVGLAAALALGIVVSRSLFEIQAERERRFATVYTMYTRGDYAAALSTIETSSLHRAKDPKVRLLRAQLLYDLERLPEAQRQLEELLDGPPHIAGAAHYLLSRVKWRTDSTQAKAHLELAETLLPVTADGHAFRALTAAAPDEALQWLDQALTLDPSHYASREARALVRYGMQDFVGMHRDAEAIVVLRPQDYRGYALRALAQREQNELEHALSDHNLAIELCEAETELPILLDQRQETYWRMGDCQSALADAQQSVALAPDNSMYRAALSKILFRLGQYDQAKQEFKRLLDNRNDHAWLVEMGRYVSDAINNGESIDLPEDFTFTWSYAGVSPGVYLPTVIELCQMLRPWASRLVRGSFDVSSWSPDGKELAYTRSEFYRWDDEALQTARLSESTQRKGIEVLDLESGRRRVLATSGGRPTWSPDGRFVAFVRASDYVYRSDEEVWLVPAHGGEARRVAEGNCPGWTNHPTRLYFVSRVDGMLCYVDVDDPTSPPTQVAPCRAWYMQVSPDERLAACFVDNELIIEELATRKELVRWAVPGIGRGCIRWSPNGKEVSVGIGLSIYWPSGLWIFNVERKEGRHVLDPMAFSCNWSPGRSHLALDLRWPMSEIWLTEVDPNLPTWEALGGGQTRGEYLRGNWEKHVPSSQYGDSVPMARILRNMSDVAVNQYELEEYDDALWTLQHIAEVPDVQGTSSEVKTLAYVVMTLVCLDRLEEAQQTLRRLRDICAMGQTPDETHLYEAEVLLAAQDSTLVSMWQSIQDGQPNYTMDLLEDKEAELSTPGRAEAVESIRQALARIFYQSAQEAEHQDLGLETVVACYETALRADPNHVPALRDLALLLATSPDTNMRDGARARQYAQRACKIEAYQDHACLASLAAASAECGDFAGAVQWQRQALECLPEGWSDHEPAARLRLYESGRHLHAETVEPLVVWWPFTATDAEASGNVQDASGHGLRGTLVGDAKVVADSERGYVLSLDGQGDWMECGNSARFSFVSEIAISMWIKVTTFDKPHQAIITREKHAWEFLRRPFGGMIGFHCLGLDVQNGTLGVLVGRKEVDDGQWHHIAGVYDGTMIYQYVDGALDTSAPARGTINLDDGPVYLGRSQFFSNCQWNGSIDDVRIYNNALSVTQIRAILTEEGSGITQR